MTSFEKMELRNQSCLKTAAGNKMHETDLSVQVVMGLILARNRAKGFPLHGQCTQVQMMSNTWLPRAVPSTCGGARGESWFLVRGCIVQCVVFFPCFVGLSNVEERTVHSRKSM